MKKNPRRGQSILEYTLVLGAVIAVVVFIVFRQGGLKSNIEGAYNSTASALNRTVDDLGNHGIFSD